ncbi:MAG TPA: carboxymuconolactone decarboxylase family protein [Candidatus Dormibacteraeota bacterium]|jgi:4-carboxymuconolactone decarboxylase|nr:carboxymuconolactone decarboxylase family protein [Candidatus Dormibacteraeota bacterium]
MSDDDLRSAGRARRARAQGPKADKLQDALRALDPQVADWADRFIFGEVWGREGLDPHERMLVAIAALGANGNLAQLRNYLFGALHDGVPPRKVHETLVMLAVYAGFPRAISALDLWREVAEAAKRQGVNVDVEFGGA